MTDLTASARPSYVYGVHGEGAGEGEEEGGWRGRGEGGARRSPADHVTEDVSRETGTDLHLLSAPEAVDETDGSRETD